MTGSIKYFDMQKGYGIIIDEKGKELYCNYINIKKVTDYNKLHNGVKVKFTKENEEIKNVEVI